MSMFGDELLDPEIMRERNRCAIIGRVVQEVPFLEKQLEEIVDRMVTDAWERELLGLFKEVKPFAFVKDGPRVGDNKAPGFHNGKRGAWDKEE